MATTERQITPATGDLWTKDYGKTISVLEVPHLIAMPRRSYERFMRDGLRELFDEISPIEDFTGSRMSLALTEYRLEEPKYSERECRQRDTTYGAPLRVRAELTVKVNGEVKEQELFLGDLPLMTEQGTFIINGSERVVVSQLVRSPGVYFTETRDPATGRRLTAAKLIPNRGAWLEFETSAKDLLSVKVDRKRKIPVTILLRAIDMEEGLSDEELGTEERVRAMLGAVDTDEDHSFLDATLAKDPAENRVTALEEFYRRLRPGDPPTAENARNLLDSLFFSERRYDLGRVGRYKVNKRLAIVEAPEQRTLRSEDIIAIVRKMIEINNGMGQPDDIDHLGNRRVRSVGELIQNQFRVGLLRMERVVRERMTITDPEEATPSALVNVRPVVAAMKEFFGGSQLSQFMDQTNPLAELAHKRRLSALGPGGLSRDRAGFDVRDVHFTHYGRICPIETPEGPNIGLIGNLATYGRVNDFGFIETPYRPVLKEVGRKSPELVGRVLAGVVKDASGKQLARSGQQVDGELAAKLAGAADDRIEVQPFASRETVYLDAHTEEEYRIGQASTQLDEHSNLVDERVEVRHAERLRMVPPTEVDYVDVSPKQIVSVAAALIPFLEHDDANRALMGANMQRQAVPLVRPEVPLVGTGMEKQVAIDSGQVIMAEEDGEVLSATSNFLTLRYQSGREERYPLMKFVRSNQGTCISQRPLVRSGDRVKQGQPLVDSSSTQNGELALGQSVLVAFMSWEGLNFEDAIVLSESVIRDDKFTSIHIEKYEVEGRDTKLGPEEITRDIPNVGEESLRDLDERGIVRVGAEVREGDILVGKITPKGETELTPEEKLLRAIFGEKAREVKDTSLRVPPRRARQGDRRPRLRTDGQRRAAGRREHDGARLGGTEAQDLRGRQDGRPSRQQGRRLPDHAGRGHALPRRRAADRDPAQPDRRALADERRPGARDAPRMGRQHPRHASDHAGLRRSVGRRDRGCARACLARAAGGGGLAGGDRGRERPRQRRRRPAARPREARRLRPRGELRPERGAERRGGARRRCAAGVPDALARAARRAQCPPPGRADVREADRRGRPSQRRGAARPGQADPLRRA